MFGFGSSFPCSQFFEDMKAHYNLRRVDLNDLINKKSFWGNDTIGRIFCHIFNIRIITYTVINTVRQDIWPARINEIDLVSDIENDTIQVPTGYIYNVQNLHFQYLDK